MMKPEILSPAGSMDSLKAAVLSGADAVYIGGNEFNARRSACNFDNDELKNAIEYAHIYGVKVYITVNILIKESELTAFGDYIRLLSDIGADGLIIQDIGASYIARKIAPELELHASTQMTITNFEGVRLLEEFGFKRVVLARELSAHEINSISKKSTVELEIFVHGAVCMCYSGQCLMSSVIGGRSGNRGMCAQPCRLPYDIVKNDKVLKSGYILSPKDMCLIESLDEIKKLNVDSLKIEGRLKRPEYVSAVTCMYKKYLDNNDKVSQNDIKELNDSFNRGGFSDGYFKNKLGSNMMTFDNPSNEASNIFSEKVHNIINGKDGKKIPVTLSAYLELGQNLTITYTDDKDNSVCLISDEIAEKANTKGLYSETLSNRLCKTGSTPYIVVSTDIYTDNQSILTASTINSLRRRALDELSKIRATVPNRSTFPLPNYDIIKREKCKKISVYATTHEQALVANSIGIERIYVKSNSLNLSNCSEIVYACDNIDLPNSKENNVLIQNISQIKKNKNIYGGMRLNVTNSYTANYYSYFKAITLSTELNIKEINEIAKHTRSNLEVIAYGKIPLMLMKNCPLKSCGLCQNHKAIYKLRDRKGYEFPITCNDNCISEIQNSKAIYIADKLEELLCTGIDSICLRFTDESPEETEKIILEYKSAMFGNTINKMEDNRYTRGHFFRGVK